jgi:hypothetical protein
MTVGVAFTKIIDSPSNANSARNSANTHNKGSNKIRS